MRYRLVTEQNGEQHVGSTILAADEIWDHLDTEETIHVARGWNVTRHGAMLRAQKGDTVRWIWCR